MNDTLQLDLCPQWMPLCIAEAGLVFGDGKVDRKYGFVGEDLRFPNEISLTRGIWGPSIHNCPAGLFVSDELVARAARTGSLLTGGTRWLGYGPPASISRPPSTLEADAPGFLLTMSRANMGAIQIWQVVWSQDMQTRHGVADDGRCNVDDGGRDAGGVEPKDGKQNLTSLPLGFNQEPQKSMGSCRHHGN